MKRFFLKAMLLLLPAIIVFVSINEKYKTSDEWKRQNDVWKFNFVPQGIQLANMGSSHGQCNFKYDIQNKYVGFNFGLSSQVYYYDYNLLDKYINNFCDNAVLIILISYFNITRIPSNKNFDDYRARYYRILDPHRMDYWNFFDWLRYSIFPILTNDFKNCHYGASDEELSFFYTRTKIDMSVEELEKSCNAAHSRWTSSEKEKGEEGFAYNKQMVSKIIDLCKLHNIKPVLITTPVTDCLNGYFEKDEGFFDTFYRFTDEICSEYPDVLYFDYSHDKEFSSNTELFQDGDHLNVYGAEKFTARVISDLENAGLLH